MIARRLIRLLGLLTLTLAYPLAAVASGITYVDMFEQWNGPIRVGPDEIVRLWVSSSGCRAPYDSPPSLTGNTIEFSLGFSSTCFSTPPAFSWAANIGPLSSGTYTVNYYRQFFGATLGPKMLEATQTLLVGPRPSAPAVATPGLADPSFGTDGVLRSPAYFVGPIRIEAQTGGRILVDTQALVSRLTDVCAFDGDFAQEGQLWLTDDEGRIKTGVAAVGANDEILVAGFVFNAPFLPTSFGLRRYSSRGELTAEIAIDPTAFPVGPLTPGYPFPVSFGTEVASLPDGRFIAAVAAADSANYGPFKWFVVRFTPDGKLDKSFGNAGIYAGPSVGFAYRLVPTDDGGLLVLGTDSKTTPATFLMKLTGAGQIDRSFGQDGFVYGSFARCTPRLQNDGSIFVGQTDFSILKLLSNGVPDLSFGNSGVLANQTGMPLLLQDFLRQTDGKFVLAGALFLSSDPFPGRVNSKYQPVLARYMQDGTLDTTFGDHGSAKIGTTTTVGLDTDDTTPIETMSLLGLPNGAGVLAVNEERGFTTYVYRFQGDSNPPQAPPNYQGLWWNAPAGSEAGWGVNFAHQGDVIFASWFTYDPAGKPWWLVMTAAKTADKTYAGSLYQVDGPAFDAAPFPPVGQLGGATGSIVGEATLTFGDENNAVFTYAVNGLAQTKAITRQAFGLLPTCSFGTATNLALATNYQDLWWAAPSGSEAGWGINLAHQGDTIFATWFTYDRDHSPMWLAVTAGRTASASYTGALYQATSGPPFNAVPFPALGSVGGAIGGIVGSATFTFGDGNHGTFAYTVDGTAQTKAITREIFASPGTVCR